METLFPYVFEHEKMEQIAIMKHDEKRKRNIVLFSAHLTGYKSAIGKMAKNVRKQQLGLLLDYMEQEPEIARGFVKCDKTKVDSFWQRITRGLNGIGPPNKNEAEWKRVWNDQKKYVRKKAQQNLLARKRTGGGPFVEKSLSSLEQRIYDTFAMQVAVEGVEGARCFGGEAEILNDLISPPTTSTTLSTVGAALSGQEEQPAPNTSAQQAKPAPKKTVMKLDMPSLLKAELTTQQDILSKLLQLVQIGQQSNCIAKAALAENKRHNREMERIARANLK